MIVELRRVTESDFPVLYEQQLDPEATRLAAFPSRDWPAFQAHWRKILADETVTNRTILADGEVAGHIGCWAWSGEPEIGYWIGRSYWGRGIGTRALSAFLEIVTIRPLAAYVAKHNAPSIRILEKCGFARDGEDGDHAIFRLR